MVLNFARDCIRTEKRRGFQPPWYRVLILKCRSCGKETALKVNWRGPTPPGGIYCPHCRKPGNDNI